MNENIDKKPKFLPPFRKFCMTVGELPSSYTETMSYYEMLLWFTKYLGDTVIPAINNNAEALKEVQDLYTDLKEYVDNYFDNLDIQTEIDNKLDDMADSGELANIISIYLNSNAIFGFNTVADLVASEILADGTFVRTYGKISLNDGDGHFYKIRTKLESDVIDNDVILGLTNYDNLIAERIFENDKPRKIIILGDSYANRVNSWADQLQTALNLSNSDCVIKRVSGVGFYNTVDGKNFNTMVIDNIGLNPIEVTDIIVCGGYNDIGLNDSTLATAFTTFVTTCKTNYPNAKIHVGFIGWCRPEVGTVGEYNSLISNLSYTRNQYIINCSKHDNVHYLNNVEYALHDISNLDSSYFHPNENGQAKICELVKQSFETGSCNYNSQQKNITSSFTPNSFISSVSYDPNGGGFYSSIENGISKLFSNNNVFLTFDGETSFNLSNPITIGSLINGYVQGHGGYIVKSETNALIKTSNNGYFMIPATLFITGGSLVLKARVLNRTGDGWITDTIDYIDINGINFICDSMLQY